MKRRNAWFLLAAMALLGLLVGGYIGARYVERVAPDIHSPVGCVVLVPCVVLFIIGTIALAIAWVRRDRS